MLSYRNPSPFARYDDLRHPIPHTLIAPKLPRPHADSKGSELEFWFQFDLLIGTESRKSSSEKPLPFYWLAGRVTAGGLLDHATGGHGRRQAKNNPHRSRWGSHKY